MNVPVVECMCYRNQKRSIPSQKQLMKGESLSGLTEHSDIPPRSLLMKPRVKLQVHSWNNIFCAEPLVIIIRKITDNRVDSQFCQSQQPIRSTSSSKLSRNQATRSGSNRCKSATSNTIFGTICTYAYWTVFGHSQQLIDVDVVLCKPFIFPL